MTNGRCYSSQCLHSSEHLGRVPLLSQSFKSRKMDCSQSKEERHHLTEVRKCLLLLEEKGEKGRFPQSSSRPTGRGSGELEVFQQSPAVSQ